MKHLTLPILISTFLAAGPAAAATFATGDGSDLTGTLFADFVATGGNDLRADGGTLAAHAWEIPSGGKWLADGSQTIAITGIALAIWTNGDDGVATNNTQSGTFTFTFHGLGADADVGAAYAGDTLIGTTTARFDSTGNTVGNYYVNFDTPVVWTAVDSLAFSVSVQSDAALRLKTGPTNAGVEAENVNDGTTRAGYLMSLSIAGTVSSVPEPSVALLGGLGGLLLLRRRRG